MLQILFPTFSILFCMLAIFLPVKESSGRVYHVLAEYIV
jgi:hypothetical protein